MVSMTKKGQEFGTDQNRDTLTRIMLDDCDFGKFCKLLPVSGVVETVLWNTIRRNMISTERRSLA